MVFFISIDNTLKIRNKKNPGSVIIITDKRIWQHYFSNINYN